MRFSDMNERRHKQNFESNDDTKPTLESTLLHYGVVLHQGRRTGMTHCPLHEDNTPSLSYNLDKELWRCHSCGQGGDSYTMIMKKEGTDFRGARTVGAALDQSEGGAGGGDEGVRGSSYGGRRSVPARKGARSNGGGYQPRWRRS
ncbi:DNA primase [Streptomyces phage Danzina]|uniref:DNA primase n=4 Tax=Likavirus TaxID=1982880 RepID=A0A291AVQ2_9CAUD|nr:DNA primase [Streptomyces phage Danzina]AKY03495.1 DNA primase [Streptomyces phage Danzina]AOQ27129.1 DNA primase [Streptomyces phage Brataylor]ATE85104.1 DNA primase [Streptomyces phage Celeste]ATE85181.1 DNA primase [Streptomyces phage Dattran]